MPQQETLQTHTESSSLAIAAKQHIGQLGQQALSNFQMQELLREARSARWYCQGSREHTGTRHQLDTSTTLHVPAARQSAAGLNLIPSAPSQPFSIQELQITSENFSLSAFPHRKAFPRFEDLANYKLIFSVSLVLMLEAHRSGGCVAGLRGTFRATGFSEKWLTGSWKDAKLHGQQQSPLLQYRAGCSMLLCWQGARALESLYLPRFVIMPTRENKLP